MILNFEMKRRARGSPVTKTRSEAVHGKRHHQQYEVAALIGETLLWEIGTHTQM